MYARVTRFQMQVERREDATRITEQEITPGTVVALAENTRHAVRAVETGAFLLTIGWSGQERE